MVMNRPIIQENLKTSKQVTVAHVMKLSIDSSFGKLEEMLIYEWTRELFIKAKESSTISLKAQNQHLP
jgi:hypothetical protein